jgi:hypothetical protein
VNEFVEECRREWKRLGVPDPVAKEMADELVADLAEAEAEGAPAEEVLGVGAADPRSFAARWASERGVIQERRWTSRLPAAIATVALVPAIVGAVLLIVASPSDRQRVVLPPPPSGTLAVWVTEAPPPVRAQIQTRVATVAADHAQWVHTQVIAGDMNGSDNGTHTIGSVLLIVGLALFVPLTLFWLWRGLRRA